MKAFMTVIGLGMRVQIGMKPLYGNETKGSEETGKHVEDEKSGSNHGRKFDTSCNCS